MAIVCPRHRTPQKLGQQHAAFPLPEGGVSLSFPTDLSVASAQMMASFVNLLLKQAEQQAQMRERAKANDDREEYEKM